MSAQLVGKLVLVHSIVSKPELNDQLGLAHTFDDDKGRYAIEILTAGMPTASVSLKAANLVEWATHAVDGVPDVKKIAEATPAETLKYMREGITYTGVARACFERLLKLPIRTTGRELTSGGQIEMMVQAMDVLMNDRGELFFLLFTLSNTVVAGDDMSRHNLAAEMKDRAVRAGVYPRLATALSTHTTSDIQCVALSVFSAVATGGGFPETEARRAAAGPFLGAIASAMKLQAHRSAVQHFGMQAIAAIAATNDQMDSAPAARADAAISMGVHVAIVEAMLRHGHISGENGLCEHTLETIAFGPPDANGKGQQIQIKLPGSVLLSGCQALQLLIHSDHGDNAARINALNDAGALKAIAAAVRTNPTFSAFEKEDPTYNQPRDLASMQIVQPLILKLVGESDFKQLMEHDDYMTLIGNSDAPGFLLRCVEAMAENGADMQTIMSALSALGPHPAPGLPFTD